MYVRNLQMLFQHQFYTVRLNLVFAVALAFHKQDVGGDFEPSNENKSIEKNTKKHGINIQEQSSFFETLKSSKKSKPSQKFDPRCRCLSVWAGSISKRRSDRLRQYFGSSNDAGSFLHISWEPSTLNTASTFSTVIDSFKNMLSENEKTLVFKVLGIYKCDNHTGIQYDLSLPGSSKVSPQVLVCECG